MKNNETNFFNDFINHYNECKETDRDIDLDFVINNLEMTEKKALVLERILDSDEFVFFADWPYPFFDVKTKDCGPDDVVVYGPYVSGKEIVFYFPNNQLLLVFTYFPLDRVFSVTNETHAKGINYVDDNTVREIKSYVYDNVSLEDFDKIVTVKSTKDISFLEFKKYPILTTRYSSSSDELFKIVQNYSWDFVLKNQPNEGN